MNPTLTNNLTTFPLLADVKNYLACQSDFVTDSHRRTYWIDLFRDHYARMMKYAREVELAEGCDPQDIEQRIADSQSEFNDWLDEVAEKPSLLERFDTITLCRRREYTLRKYNFADPYRLAKQRETDAALKLAPDLFAAHDQMENHGRLMEVVKGIFAGNIFDLGAKKTIEIIENGNTKNNDPTTNVDFHKTITNLKPRPWRYDDLDTFITRIESKPYNAAVLFVDNAGCDAVLGMMGFARELLRRGTEVIITANTTPALNDVIYEELIDIVNRIAEFDPLMQQSVENNQLELVASGNDVPLIDLTKVSPQLVEAVTRRNVDLVVLEGMGRGVESNFHVPFTCDVLKVAMLKDLDVAAYVDAEVFDLVFRYEQS